MRKFLIILLACIAPAICSGQYTYFNQIEGGLENSSESIGNLEIIGDSIFVWGAEVIDGFLYQFVRIHDLDGQVINELQLFFPEDIVYVGTINSFQKISDENSFLFTQGILEGGELKGFIMKMSDEPDTLWTKTFEQYAPETNFYTFAEESDGFILAGEFGPEAGERGTFLMKIDHEGNHLWDAVVHQPQEGIFRNFNITPINDGYLLSGATGGGAQPMVISSL